MKTFNFFTRPQNDLQKSTLSGAVVSLLTIFAGIYLTLYIVFSQRQHTEFDKRFVVSQQTSGSEIEVSFSILFLNAPCAALRLQKEDPTISQYSTIRSGVTFLRVKFPDETLRENGTRLTVQTFPEKYIDPDIVSEHPNEDEQTQIILTGLKNEEQCLVYGRFFVKKAPGSFMVGHELVYSTLARIRQLDPMLSMRLNLGHKIHWLSFGGHVDGDLNVLEQQYNLAEGMQYTHDHPVSCFYYLKIIPKMEFATGIVDDHYQYSYHRKCYVFFGLNLYEKTEENRKMKMK